MPPTPITTTSSPTCISLYWTTPFHAPDSGSVRRRRVEGHALRDGQAAGRRSVFMYSANAPGHTSAGPSPPVVKACSQ